MACPWLKSPSFPEDPIRFTNQNGAFEFPAYQQSGMVTVHFFIPTHPGWRRGQVCNSEPELLDFAVQGVPRHAQFLCSLGNVSAAGSQAGLYVLAFLFL